MLEKINNNWKERLKDLKCVNGAMYFGSYENPCDCGDVGCVNQATFEDNIKELENFIEQLISERDKEILKEFVDYLIIPTEYPDTGITANKITYDGIKWRFEKFLQTLNK